ncbi:nucleoside-diphosphate-sugar epimerase [Fontibacillus phaseoli]|uniref:Nucleoside-diphosphate-sugar epimerase n=1 Tax=Fontibacillus phaseoli TaxID=1416533 RepID=A0A369BBV5_9BACL|nr:NAD(P)-dependent oxidoreductase [Fontibacillus phaseoli]RCX19009.1 nucleoside-diphosphate-sugar epimerase [Fontibacillus phaseoli]
MGKDAMKSIAILGASGHVGKNVTKFLSEKPNYRIYLFVRSQRKMVSFLRENKMMNNDNISIFTYEDFRQGMYDIVINCIGIGDPNELLRQPYRIFQITEEFDNLVLNYIGNNSNTLYINFSSGAIYGTDFNEEASESKLASIDINHLGIKDFYGISKLHMEAKHRSLANNFIVDIRIFGFFSRYIDRNSSFFLNDVTNSILNNKPLITSRQNMIRDYIHPSDLMLLIECCIDKHSINTSYDAYSLNPVTKVEIIEQCIMEHKLQVQYQNDAGQSQSVTGSKSNYYSVNKSAAEIGYCPSYSSMKCVLEVINQLKSGILNV